MSRIAARLKYSFEEFVALENASPTKHEFYDGEILAMAGGTPEHAEVGLNVGSELRARLRGTSCRVYSSDLRVRVAETGLTTYPDVSVVCGPLERDPQDPNSVLNPRVIVEVLSDSTESYDREDKFAQYRRIPSLAAYVLISQKERRIEVFHRNPDGTWTLNDVRPPEIAQINAIDCVLRFEDVYGDVLRSAL